MMQFNGRAKEILAFIIRFQATHGAPPSLREIGRHFKIRSTNGVSYYLDLLEQGGAIRRRKGRARGITLRGELSQDQRADTLVRHEPAGIPILGQIAAGGPVVAEEHTEGFLDGGRLSSRSASFALRVHGDSMRDAGILDGDLVLVKAEAAARNGDIVVAMIGDETTVKRFRRAARTIHLLPENPAYEPIVVTARSPELRILGKVVGVYREMGS